MSDWINVKKRQPRKKERVIYLANYKGLICIGPYHGLGKSGCHYFMSGNRLDTALWWMPLPELPKEVKTNG